MPGQIRYLVFIFFLFTIKKATAQDIIVTVNAEEIHAKILIITADSIIFIPDSAEAAKQSLPKASIFMIKYNNGSKEIFENNLPGIEQQQVYNQSGRVLSDFELYNEGLYGAEINYNATYDFAVGAATGCLLNALGIVPLIMYTTKSADPEKANLDPQFKNNTHYRKGYSNRTKEKKKFSAVAGYGTGLFISCCLITYIYAINIF